MSELHKNLELRIVPSQAKKPAYWCVQEEQEGNCASLGFGWANTTEQAFLDGTSFMNTLCGKDTAVHFIPII